MITNGSGRNGEAVLHVAYKDGVCGEKWGEIVKLPKDVMDQEIHRVLEYKFNRKIPKPPRTVYQLERKCIVREFSLKANCYNHYEKRSALN